VFVVENRPNMALLVARSSVRGFLIDRTESGQIGQLFEKRAVLDASEVGRADLRGLVSVPVLPGWITGSCTP
jgi:hypothetical protein